MPCFLQDASLETHIVDFPEKTGIKDRIEKYFNNLIFFC